MIHELPDIIDYDGVGNSELTHNALPHKVSDILDQDGGDGLDLYPCGEIIYPDQEEFSFCLAEGTNDVYSSNGKQPWRHHVVECLGLEVR